jgi:glucose-6-phosphate isomerase
MTPVRVDPSFLLEEQVGPHGLAETRFSGDLGERFAAAHRDVEERRSSGEMGFFDLPYAEALRSQVQELADSFGQWFESVVVIGIGGSSLGSRAIADALRGPFWNERTAEERDHFPRLYFLENSDPDTIRDVLGRIDLRKTLFNVVSKSGTTAETMAQYLVVEAALREELDPEHVAGHFLFTTDPEVGALRALARERGVLALELPSRVGGRFSVLSSVGLLPGAVIGVEIADLLEGAAEMDRLCRSERIPENPAGLLATCLHWAQTEGGRPIHVLMPYSDRLRTFGLWFQQLWAESLGKARTREGEIVHTGPTPVAALGAVDQHSLLQLLMEGPDDKVVCFVRVRERNDAVPIPESDSPHPSLAYLGGHSLEKLLEVERRATSEALRRVGRPSLTVEVERLDARSLGGLFMLFQIATVYAGALYGVDPLDQPGVEMGKVITREMLAGGG